MSDCEKQIQQRLFALQDADYRDFQSKLIPTLPPEKIIGVRTPQLRALAKEISRLPERNEFMAALPHTYFEENNLHAFLIENIRSFPEVISELQRFLPWVDNWATCDQMNPKVFVKYRPALLPLIRAWLGSDMTYKIRFGMRMLMNHFLEEDFRPEYLAWVADAETPDYYVKMMVAWYFATALGKQYEAALPYLTERRLEPWTHNKAIQKATESRRLNAEQKTFLRRLRQ